MCQKLCLIIPFVLASPSLAADRGDYVERAIEVTIFDQGLPEPDQVARPSDLIAHLHYAIDQGPSSEPRRDQISLDNDDRDDKGNFVFSIWDERFLLDHQRGFVWGEMQSGGQVIRRIPLQVFDSTELNSDHSIFELSVTTTEPGGDSLAASEPFLARSNDYFSDNEVYFSLSIVDALISNGFVTSDAEWKAMFDIFQNEADFFRSAAAEDTGRILSYLQRQYEPMTGSLVDNDEFVEHYVEFLNEMLSMEVWGAIPPDSGSNEAYMRSYLEARLRAVAEQDSVIAIESLVDTQERLIELQQFRMCLRIATVAMQNLRWQIDGWNLEDGRELDAREVLTIDSINLLVEGAVICAQRLFVNSSMADDAVMGNAAGGIGFLQTDRDGLDFLRSFYKLSLILRDAGRLWLPEGPDQMTYAYFEGLRSQTDDNE